ncbi:3-deoxy-D-manno-octulosonic acid transferase [Tenacibaculum sp. 190130A14a]|uniref:3-deoxy-D-manno-octulosonic acid transferase n=1 Tax=Tenacibaculum polynesiense TaxID=3137857 RepID=A0ABP1EUU3_9FLAO
MSFLYNLFLHLISLLLPIIALFNHKIKLFAHGRKETFSKLSSIKKEDKVVWIHAASLGEFEQARPIIENIKVTYPNYKVVVSFFSPSGYEIRKNYPLADIICYLPIDTKSNVKKFIKQLHPTLAIIVKYEFWPNLLQELKNTNTSTLLISGIFRKKQSFFKSYGSFMKNKLSAFNHFFVQNEESKKLLNSINFNNVTVSGDTRFDRVYEILQQDNTLDFIEDFKNNKYTLVAGSTWKEDEELLVDYINNTTSTDEKFIIAPHNIKLNQIKELTSSLSKKTVLFSEKDNVNLKEFQVFIIDTIGLLTKIYAYGDIAYVGGGLATGLHNILEPATYGIPVVFGGNKYQKFKEANDLLELGSATIVTNKIELTTTFASIKNDNELRFKMGNTNQQYIKNNVGATQKILTHLKDIL